MHMIALKKLTDFQGQKVVYSTNQTKICLFLYLFIIYNDFVCVFLFDSDNASSNTEYELMCCTESL